MTNKLFKFHIIVFLILFGCNPAKVIIKNKDLAQKLVCEPSTIIQKDTIFYTDDTTQYLLLGYINELVDNNKFKIDSIKKLTDSLKNIDVCKTLLSGEIERNSSLIIQIKSLKRNIQDKKVEVHTKYKEVPVYKDTAKTLAALEKANKKVKNRNIVIICLMIFIVIVYSAGKLGKLIMLRK